MSPPPPMKGGPPTRRGVEIRLGDIEIQVPVRSANTFHNNKMLQ